LARAERVAQRPQHASLAHAGLAGDDGVLALVHVPGGGLAPDGRTWIPVPRRNVLFLVPVKVARISAELGERIEGCAEEDG
jgi:hypothetical protein